MACGIDAQAQRYKIGPLRSLTLQHPFALILHARSSRLYAMHQAAATCAKTATDARRMYPVDRTTGVIWTNV